jgi:hypothetical protein
MDFTSISWLLVWDLGIKFWLELDSQCEPAPTKCTITDEWCVEMTLFFHWVLLPQPHIQGFCSKSELRVLQWGVVHPTGWWVHGWYWVTQAKLNTMCVSDIGHSMYAYNGWAWSMKVHASRWEVLDDPVVTEVFNLKFEPAKKDRIVR